MKAKILYGLMYAFMVLYAKITGRPLTPDDDAPRGPRS